MTTSVVTRQVRQQQDVAVVRARVAPDEIATFLGGAFGEVMAVAAQQGRRVTGMPFGRYRPTTDGTFDVEAGFPVDSPVITEGRVEAGTLPAGPTASVVHTGSYEDLGQAYEEAIRSVEEAGGKVSGAPWESYLDEPSVAEPRTEVVVPYIDAAATAS